MMYRERIFRDEFAKAKFEKSRDLTAKCIPYLKQKLGGEFVHTEQFNKQSFAVTLDVDHGIDLIWVKNNKLIPIGVRTADKDLPLMSISCDNYSTEKAEYDEIKTDPLSPAFMFKLTIVNDKLEKLYIAKADELIEYIDTYRPKKVDSPKSKHWFYSISIDKYRNMKNENNENKYYFREYIFEDCELE